MSNSNIPTWLQNTIPAIITTVVSVLITLWVGKEIMEARYEDLRQIVHENRAVMDEIRTTRDTNRDAEKDQTIILTEIRMLQTQIDLLRAEMGR